MNPLDNIISRQSSENDKDIRKLIIKILVNGNRKECTFYINDILGEINYYRVVYVLKESRNHKLLKKD